ncbi:MAG: tRNA lysidine(34) synthetase TilS, partial [Lachnospiraceae bacterium]|nr:tRNA lysidine(34) synthetase TilS [Lachnospiraceae bacterium]
GGRGNTEASLPYGLVVYKQSDWGMIQKRGEKKGPEAEERYELPAGVRVEIPGLGIVESTVFPRKESQNIPEKTYTKWFDYDKITSSVVFRHRQKGDYLTINSKMGRKSLQDYFVNEKVPEKERDKRFVLADGAHLLWVPGLRISEYYKITENTRNILQVSVADKEE